MDYTKPVIKWVGGKTQIIDTIMKSFPKEINNYHEIFLGGGSVIIALLENIKADNIKVAGKIYAYDLNETLINIYKNIQKNPEGLVKELKKIKTEYENINGEIINRKAKILSDAQSQESYYYYSRHRFNSLTQIKKNSIEGSALFIFINKTCFRGLYREGKNGINVPFGHYKNPAIYDKKHILLLSELFKDVVFECQSFEQSIDIKKIKKNDFIYMDPPYAPETETSFVGYSVGGFDIDMHNLLFEKCFELHIKNIKFVMSNSKVKLVLDTFADKKKFSIESILCKRHINSKKPNAMTNEVLINNIIINNQFLQ